jgi:orotidine-5'-phosphate decarboxylase
VADMDGCERLVLAIDQTEVSDVLNVGRSLLSRVGCVKISSHLVQRMPPGRAFDFVRNHRARKIFYDARFVDDRPDNLAADIRVVCGIERAHVHPPELVSVHYAVGLKALQRAVQAAGHHTEVVVFLSSSNWSDDDYRTMHDATPEEMVRKYARIAADAGATSVMCAAIDAWVIRDDPHTRHLTIYGTGIRRAGESGGEHKRIVTPQLAVQNGLDYLVVGTPIVKANDPLDAFGKYETALREAQKRPT